MRECLVDLLGGEGVITSGGGGPVVLPDRAALVGELIKLAVAEGFDVRTPAGPRTTRPGRDSVLLRLDRLQGALSLDTTSCTATVAGGLTGADLAWRLHREGFWLRPHPTPFYREPIGTWLAGPGLAGELTALTWWESPLMSLEAVLGDGQPLRAGVAPRSAAGPDYRAFLLGGGDRVGVITEVVWRVFRRSVPMLFAARLPDQAAALTLAADHCRVGWRPWSSFVARGAEPERVGRPDRWTDGRTTLLLCHRAEGERAAMLRRQLGAAVDRAGGEVLDAAAARPWYERSFLGWCERGPEAASVAEDERLGDQVGTAWIAAPWPALPELWRRLEDKERTVRAVVSAEGLRPEGGLLKLRLVAIGDRYRDGRARYHLARAVGAVGGRVVAYLDRDGDPVPPGQSKDASQELLEAVADGLGPQRVLNPPPRRAAARKGG